MIMAYSIPIKPTDNIFRSIPYYRRNGVRVASKCRALKLSWAALHRTKIPPFQLTNRRLIINSEKSNFMPDCETKIPPWAWLYTFLRLCLPKRIISREREKQKVSNCRHDTEVLFPPNKNTESLQRWTMGNWSERRSFAHPCTASCEAFARSMICRVIIAARRRRFASLSLVSRRFERKCLAADEATQLLDRKRRLRYDSLEYSAFVLTVFGSAAPKWTLIESVLPQA